jgi:F5/8 type C domain
VARSSALDAGTQRGLKTASLLMAPADRKHAFRAMLEWFWRGNALARARAAREQMTNERLDLMQRADACLALAERALATGGSRTAESAALAVDLCRQAVYWALLSRAPELGRPTPQALWEASGADRLTDAATGSDDLGAIRAQLDLDFVRCADLPADEQRRAAERLERLARRLIEESRRPVTQLEEIRIQRFVGIVLAIACVLAVVVGTVAGIRRLTRPVDLAVGAAWKTSSEWAKCHPAAGECAGMITNILFHTKEDQSPWFEYDFGKPIRFSSITVVNRQDDVPERAVPLIAEVSNDHVHYTEVARRNQLFSTWKPKFPTQQARYLRLRVARKTWLHLEAVRVHP